MEKKIDSTLLSTTPPPKAIITLAIPATMAFLIMAIYNFVDTLFIAKLNDDLALTAVSVAFPIMTLIGAVGQVMGAGASAFIGRAFGSQKEEFASQIGATITLLSFIVAIAFMSIGLLFIEPIFKLFGTTEMTMPYAVEYGRWMYIGTIFSIPNQIFNNVARAEARTVLSMKALIIGAVANIILDPIFMFDLNGFGLNMGLEGASIATAISQGLTFFYIAYFFFAGKMRVKLQKRYITWTREIIGNTLVSGAPIGVTQMLSTIAVAVTNVTISVVATTEMAGIHMQSAYGVVLRIVFIFQFIIIGFLQGYQPIASFAYGAKNQERFFESFRFAFKYVMVYAVFITAFIQLVTPYAVAVFSETPEVIEMGILFMRCNTIFTIFVAYTMFLMLTFQATGNGKYGAILALTRQGVLYIPLLLIFGFAFGTEGIFYAQPLSDILTTIIAVFLYKKYKKELMAYFAVTVTKPAE